MVLDDSDDDTVTTMSNTVKKYQRLGFDIEHIRRGTRNGYKAGALKHAMKSTDSEFVAIFDADFIPPNWYLKKAMPHFAESNIGLVQCRWGHINENYSALTQAQALNLDFHFLIECNRLTEHYQHPILLVEGNVDQLEELTDNPLIFYGALSTVALEFKIPIIPTPSATHTAKLLVSLSTRKELSKGPFL